MAIIFVTSDTVFGRFLAGCLKDKVDKIFVESGREPVKFYLKKLRRVGAINFVFGWWLKRYFERVGEAFFGELDLYGKRVRSINNLVFCKDGLVICFGTSIVKKVVFESAGEMWNVHTGLLPEYRGVKSEFWALSSGGRCGFEVHQISEKIDCGKIIVRKVVRKENCRCPARMRCYIIEDVARALKSTLDFGFCSGELVSFDSKSKYYTTPTWKQWKEYWRLQKQSRGISLGVMFIIFCCVLFDC